MKNNRLSLIVFSFLGFALASPSSFADGNEHGNGGGAIVCRDAEQKIQSAELLDLFEAKAGGQKLLEKNLPKEKWIIQILNQIAMNNPAFSSRIRQALNNNARIIIEIPEGVSITPPNDAYPWLQKDGCRLEGVAQYRDFPDGPKLFIDPVIFEALPVMHQVALVFHEAIYKVLRETDGDKDSLRTRYMVSQLFNEAPFPQSQPDNNSFLNCFVNSGNFDQLFPLSILVFNEKDRFHFALTRFDGKWIFPSIILSPLPSANPEFDGLTPFLFRRVNSREQWKTFPEEVFTSFALESPGLPKVLAFRLSKAEFSPFSPVYNLKMHVHPERETLCYGN